MATAKKEVFISLAEVEPIDVDAGSIEVIIPRVESELLADV